MLVLIWYIKGPQTVQNASISVSRHEFFAEYAPA